MRRQIPTRRMTRVVKNQRKPPRMRTARLSVGRTLSNKSTILATISIPPMNDGIEETGEIQKHNDTSDASNGSAGHRSARYSYPHHPAGPLRPLELLWNGRFLLLDRRLPLVVQSSTDLHDGLRKLESPSGSSICATFAVVSCIGSPLSGLVD